MSRDWLIQVVAALCLLGAGLWPRGAGAAEPVPAQLRGTGVDERLGGYVDPQLAFTDHTGQAVRLGDYFKDGKTVLLTLNYYRCPTLCNLQLNAVTDGLRGLSWTPGDNYRIVTVSIDHREGAELAKGKRATYLESLGRGEVDWTFLVGTEDNVRALADQVGYHFEYDAKQGQYAHPLVVMFLSPAGMVSRYLYGMEYSARDLKFALMEASQGRLGSPVDKVILSCFHYDASIGAYGPFAMGIMRLGGALTLTVMLIAGVMLWRKDRTRRYKEVHP